MPLDAGRAHPALWQLAIVGGDIGRNPVSVGDQGISGGSGSLLASLVTGPNRAGCQMNRTVPNLVSVPERYVPGPV